MLKKIMLPQTLPNLAMSHSFVLIMGLALLIGLLLYRGMSWSEDVSSPPRASNSPQVETFVTDEGDNPLSLLSYPFTLVADPDNQVIRRVDPNTGEATLVAGQVGQLGWVDGRGTTARFRDPMDVAVSADGTFALVADTGNHAIRRIDLSTGEVTTLAGLGGLAGSDDGRGMAARFYYPHSIALSASGNFALVADTHNHTIRRIDLRTGVVTTLAGQPDASGSEDGPGRQDRFYYPHGLALSPDDTFILVADFGNHLIRRIDLHQGSVEVTTLAGDDITNRASLDEPYDVIINPAEGMAVVTDTNNWPIWQIDLVAGELKLLDFE